MPVLLVRTPYSYSAVRRRVPPTAQPHTASRSRSAPPPSISIRQLWADSEIRGLGGQPATEGSSDDAAPRWPARDGHWSTARPPIALLLPAEADSCVHGCQSPPHAQKKYPETRLMYHPKSTLQTRDRKASSCPEKRGGAAASVQERARLRAAAGRSGPARPQALQPLISPGPRWP